MRSAIGNFVSLLFSNPKKERRYFSAPDVRETIRRQRGKCSSCKSYLNRYSRDLDHKDGNRNNNKRSNCQVLCSNCHSKKTRMKKHKKSFFSL